MKHIFFLCAFVLVLTSAHVLAATTVYLSDGTTVLSPTTGGSPNPLPVLFVHGHGLGSSGTSGFHFRKNWWGEPNNSLSFKDALDLTPQNGDLGIEPYYMHFSDQNRSIVLDAQEIREAVEWILHRHDSGYDLNVPESNRSTHVQIVIIAYSKGTISTRLYLKSLQVQVPGLNPPRPNFHPVSEFIAISPPNHGLHWLTTLFSGLSIKQLNNGYRAPNAPLLSCQSYNEPDATDFIAKLNSINLSSPQNDDEALGNRIDGHPLHEGTLYVTIFADGNRDVVGGINPVSDCSGLYARKQAKNRASNAVNLEVQEITGGTDGILVHQNTVHTSEVICLALYTALHHRKPPPGIPHANLCQKINDVPVIPLPARASVVLALDHSGSMNLPACPNPTCATRLQVLHDAVEIFIELWAAVGAPQDHIGVNYFRRNVNELSIGQQMLVPLIDHAQAVITDIQSQTASNLTAMGAGLQSAHNILQAASNDRHIVLFSDGMQNVNPMVIDTGSYFHIADDGTNRPQSNIPPAMPPTRLDTSPMGLGMKVDVIAIGSGGMHLQELQAIAGDTMGDFHATTAPNMVLRQFFIEQLISALRGFSPQLVAYRRGSAGGDETTEVFSIGDTVKKVVFKLSWQRGKNLDFRIEKDGVDVTSLGTVSNGPFYRIFALDMPAKAQGQAIKPGGQWHMRIQGIKGTAYEAASIVDETTLKYDLSLGSKDYQVGDALEMELRLFADGKPIQDDLQVTATVQAPSQSVGTLLSLNPLSGQPPNIRLEPQLTPGQRKLALFLQDEQHWHSLQPVEHPTTLKATGTGVYRTTFPSTTVPGTYRVIVRVTGESPKLGRIERTDAVSTVVRFGKAELGVSGLRIQQLGATDVGLKKALSVRPQDTHGNYLGPDFGKHIHVTLSDGTVSEEVEDPGDGTYVIPLVVPSGSDPKLSLTILGEVLYDGSLSGIPERQGQNGLDKEWVYLAVVLLLVVIAVLWLTQRRRV